MKKLSQKKCQACNEKTPALDEKTAREYVDQLNHWLLSDDCKWLSKEFKFKNFLQALEFVNKVGAIAEDQDHHPNFDFTWGFCKISLQTHKINGLSENDFILAAKIDEIS